MIKGDKRCEDRVKEDLNILRVLNEEEMASHKKIWRTIMNVAISLNGLE